MATRGRVALDENCARLFECDSTREWTGDHAELESLGWGGCLWIGSLMSTDGLLIGEPK